MNIAAIQRSTIFSPNHVGNDAAILNETATELSRLGHTVHTYSEEEFVSTPILDEEVIVGMGRRADVVAKLQQLEQQGYAVVNSGFGIANCNREEMTKRLIEVGIPHPDSLIVETTEDVREQLAAMQINCCWIKRGDFHAIHKEDVTFARNSEEAQSMLHEYSLRGIKRAVINRHLVGDLVKFYGVAGTPFFHHFYPLAGCHSKFGLEAINGMPQGLPFDSDQLQQLCNRAANLLGVVVYGGDCIVSTNGEVSLIDFNDWPSFAPCRTEAAAHIAMAIHKQTKQLSLCK